MQRGIPGIPWGSHGEAMDASYGTKMIGKHRETDGKLMGN